MVHRIVALSWLISNGLICAFAVIGDKASTEELKRLWVTWVTRLGWCVYIVCSLEVRMGEVIYETGAACTIHDWLKCLGCGAHLATSNQRKFSYLFEQRVVDRAGGSKAAYVATDSNVWGGARGGDPNNAVNLPTCLVAITRVCKLSASSVSPSRYTAINSGPRPHPIPFEEIDSLFLCRRLDKRLSPLLPPNHSSMPWLTTPKQLE